jgi:hypothetical protein
MRQFALGYLNVSRLCQLSKNIPLSIQNCNNKEIRRWATKACLAGAATVIGGKS